MKTFIRLTAIAMALALVAAACDDDNGAADDDADETPAEVVTSLADDAPQDRADPAAGGDLVAVSEGADPAPHLVDGNGFSLYLFTNDEEGVSNCTDACATTWPPLITPSEDVPVGDAVDGSLVGTIERDDGSLQVTFDGQPLYYFGGDQAPAEQNGQGSGGVWFLVGLDGSAIEA